MQEKIYKELRKKCIYKIIIFGFFSIFFGAILYSSIIGKEKSTLMGLILFGILVAFLSYKLIKNLIYYLDPTKNPEINEYGDIEELEDIVEEIFNSVIYDDNHIIISKNYIAPKNSYKNIINLDNVINAYQYIRKTNGLVTSRELVVIDINGKENRYGYNSFDEEKILEALRILSTVRNDIKIGYVR